MQLGFAMLEAGTVNENNVIATYAKNVLDFVIGTLVAAAWGYWLATGQHALLVTGSAARDFFFYVCFQATAATIVSGAMAERTSVTAYLLISVLLSGGVYSVAVRCAWTDGGLLKALDPSFIDFAGSGVVHLVGGSAAIVGAWVVGPRERRFSAAHQAKFVPHNVPSVLGGTMLLWVGWYVRQPSSDATEPSPDAHHRLLPHLPRAHVAQTALAPPAVSSERGLPHRHRCRVAGVRRGSTRAHPQGYQASSSRPKLPTLQ